MKTAKAVGIAAVVAGRALAARQSGTEAIEIVYECAVAGQMASKALAREL